MTSKKTWWARAGNAGVPVMQRKVSRRVTMASQLTKMMYRMWQGRDLRDVGAVRAREPALWLSKICAHLRN